MFEILEEYVAVKKCILCGTENRGEAMRCKGCGATLTSTPRPVIAKPPKPTILEDLPSSQGLAQSPAAGKRRTTIATPEEQEMAKASVGQAGGKGGVGRKTRYVGPEEEEKISGQAQALPRLVGYMVSYTWETSGRGYPIREGKNVFGSQSGCDGHIHNDNAMSGKHFAVMYRKGTFRIRDLDSTNATVVDGQEIWGDSTEAHQGSVIKAGDTLFQLLVVPTIEQPE